MHVVNYSANPGSQAPQDLAKHTHCGMTIRNSRMRCPMQSPHDSLEITMHAVKDLFTSDVGLMSISGIAFMLGMAVFFVRYFLRHMQEDAERASRSLS